MADQLLQSNITLLIVDDSESDRVIYSRYLQSDVEKNYHIIEAETLEDGLEICRSQPPDIVLLDLNLPDGDGLEFLEAINIDHAGKRFPVIMLTGQGNEEKAVNAMKLGAADYLVKGDITAKLLTITVNHVLRESELSRQLSRSQQQQILTSEIALRIREFLNLEDISRAIVKEVRQFIKADRAAIYKFTPDMSGNMVAEDIVAPWQSCLNVQVNDSCFLGNLGDAYCEGRIFVANDIYAANLTACHLQLLKRFQVRANLVVPILLPNENKRILWGLLILHQCSSPRIWLESDVQLIQQLAVQLSISIKQAIAYQKAENELAERKRAEQELLQLNQSLEVKVRERTQELWQVNQLLQTVLDAIPLSVFWKDRQSILLGCNQLFAITSGKNSPLEAIGKSDFDLACTEDEALAYLADDRQVMETGLGKLNIEEHITLTSGEQQWIQTNKVPLRDASGNVVGVVGTLQDISDRKQTELKLQKISDRLALALKSGAIGCWEWDIQQNDIVWDDRMYKLYGDLKETNFQIPYEIWSNAIHPDDRDTTETLLQEAVLGRTEYDCEFRVIHPDRSIHFIKAYGKVKQDTQGNAESMIGVNFDISDRKKAEIQLQSVNQELLRATKLKDEFLANMSHELRTPLNSILGISESLKDEILGSLNKKQLKAIATVESSGEHLLSLINDILDLSKISAGMIELDIESVSIKNLCSSSLIFVKQQAFNKKIQIHSHVPPQINNVNINIDERRIKQVLINLLTNAVKFTPCEGNINLFVAIGIGDTWQGEATIPQQLRDMNSPTILFQVVDTGIGISAKDLQMLFQPFVQVDSALNRQYEGTGLGLALVKQIVELHGGQVIAESEVGKGSRFTVALPYEMSASNAIAPVLTSTTSSSLAIAPDNAPLILLAEDNEANIQTFSCYLTAINYRVIIARNGLEAIAQAKANLPDIILMDIQMPIMDGLEATKQIRLDPNLVNIPIIALTALAMEGDRERCLAAGANEYLAKPIKLHQLNSAIQQILSKLL
jgi:PAS domain S-box-containing protein